MDSAARGESSALHPRRFIGASVIGVMRQGPAAPAPAPAPPPRSPSLLPGAADGAATSTYRRGDIDAPISRLSVAARPVHEALLKKLVAAQFLIALAGEGNRWTEGGRERRRRSDTTPRRRSYRALAALFSCAA